MNIAQAVPLADAWGMHGDVGAGWWIVMMVAMLLFWGAVIFGVVWLIRGIARGGSAPGERHVSRESPVEILERRFESAAAVWEALHTGRHTAVRPGGRETVGYAEAVATRRPLAGPPLSARRVRVMRSVDS